MVEDGPNTLKHKSEIRRRRSKILAVSLNHGKGRRGGGGVGHGGVPPLLLWCTAVLNHHCPIPLSALRLGLEGGLRRSSTGGWGAGLRLT